MVVALGLGQELPDPLGGVEHRPVIEMRVARCRGQPGMAEQLADHRQGFRPRGGVTGEAMTKIVQPDVGQAGLGFDLLPESVEVTQRASCELVPEHRLR